ncbi:MAG: hypothetical protein IJM01_01495 [Eubacterium sp.]|nr:hypothetical protein [Eubacterium sp.]
MKCFKNYKDRFLKLSTAKKIQVIIASVFTFSLLVGLPVFAWFSVGGKLEAFTKIKEPDNLDIRAGHYDPVQYFDLSDIDIEEIAGTDSGTPTPHRVVFSVSAGDYKIPYKLQLAHTTNIPFTYSIYRATEHTTAPQGQEYVTYISEPLKNQGKGADEYTFYYTKGTQVTLYKRNPSGGPSGPYGRQVAEGSGSYYDESYNSGNDPDDPEIYAVPIYEQSGKISPDNNSRHDFFILEISYDTTARTSGDFSEWNTAENKKETDMIYLTASRFTQ